MGPAGTGKSTLLRSLAGLNDSNPSFRQWGKLAYAPGNMGGQNKPILVRQNARLLTSTLHENLISMLPERSTLTRAQQTAKLEILLSALELMPLFEKMQTHVLNLPRLQQRLVSIARSILAQPTLLCVDEVCVGLEEHEALEVMQLLDRIAKERTVFMCTHNQSYAQKISTTIALLAGGRFIEVTPTLEFFQQPRTPTGATFLRTGSCALPSPNATAEDLSPDVGAPPELPAEAKKHISRARGPRDFYWLYQGVLGGLPRPGIVVELRNDIAALKRLGVSVLVTLEEKPTVPEAVLLGADIEPLFFPIDDMGVPNVASAISLCQHIDRFIQTEHVVALHCRAGKGRTGCMLASHLVWKGAGAVSALETVRGINPYWIQSNAQIEFLHTMAAAVAANKNKQPTQHFSEGKPIPCP